MRGRTTELVGRDAIAAEEGDQAADVDAEGDGEDRGGPRVGWGRSHVL